MTHCLKSEKVDKAQIANIKETSIVTNKQPHIEPLGSTKKST